MTQTQFAELLNSVYPTVYLAYGENECPNMPFITYFPEESNNFSADGIVYARIINLQVDLWFNDYNQPYEENLEAVFNQNGIYWEKSLEPDEDEKCIRASYSVSIDGFSSVIN